MPVTSPDRPPGLARVPSPALVVGAIASVQFGSAVAAKLFAAVGPGGAALLRLLTAAIVLGALTRPSLRGHGKRAFATAVVFGLVLAGMNISFYHALHRLPLGAAVTIEFLGPLGVAIAGTRRRLDLAWAALAAGGILLLSHGGAHGLNLVGVMFALIAAALWACYILVNARLGQAFPDASGLALAMIVAALVALPDGIIEGGGSLVHPRSLALGAAVGMLSSAIPYSLELEALRRIAVNVFGVLMSLEPAFAALAGLIVLGEGLSLRSLIGIGLVIVASAGASLSSRRPPVDG
ncbi:MAG TPA: EamA family transporter [Solirubrobacteraceae bacterium]|nr:EamA family transporter [Solirubrobacteraceae bacterium]